MSSFLESEGRGIAGTKRGAELRDFRRFFRIEGVHLSPNDWRLQLFNRIYDTGEVIRQCGRPLSLTFAVLVVAASGYVVSLGINTFASEHHQIFPKGIHLEIPFPDPDNLSYRASLLLNPELRKCQAMVDGTHPLQKIVALENNVAIREGTDPGSKEVGRVKKGEAIQQAGTLSGEISYFGAKKEFVGNAYACVSIDDGKKAGITRADSYTPPR